VQRLSAEFVPAADEVGRLQHGHDAESALFREFCEHGHYGGRTAPSDTRQGIYAIAPSGAFLASCNSRDPRVVARMLQDALAAWQALPAERRLLDPERLAAIQRVERFERHYPEAGLSLRVTTRDLPSERRARGWHARAFNHDNLWFRADEARRFLPVQPAVGAVHPVPAALVERIVRLNLVDNVRGQTSPFRRQDVELARLESEVVDTDGDRIGLRFSGETRAVQKGRWPVQGFGDADRVTEQERGFATTLSGTATFDLATGRFVAFELLATGTRWGGTQFNSRDRDLAPGPIAVAFTLATGDVADRVAPAFHWEYGWR
jgi:hypothetical protein